MKWTGTVAGIPDLAIVVPAGRIHFIEVKTETGRLSGDQRAVHDRLIALGTPAVIAQSIDDVRTAFETWRIETREART